jgi:hypothetical protein
MLAYGSLLIPINPRRSPLVLEHEIGALESRLGAEPVGAVGECGLAFLRDF